MVTTGGSEEGYTSYVLNSVDRQIIRVLQDDGRTSNVEIARRVGVSEPTVRKRLERLLSSKVIRITAVPDPARIGFSTIAFMTLGVELATASQIADQIAQLPEVRTTYITSGGSELLVEAWFTSSDDLLSFMAQHLGNIPGIKRMAISHVLRTIRNGSSWVIPFAPSFSNCSGQETEPGQATAA